MKFHITASLWNNSIVDFQEFNNSVHSLWNEDISAGREARNKPFVFQSLLPFWLDICLKCYLDHNPSWFFWNLLCKAKVHYFTAVRRGSSMKKSDQSEQKWIYI